METLGVRPQSIVLYSTANEAAARRLASQLEFDVRSVTDPEVSPEQVSTKLRLVHFAGNWQVILPASVARATVDFSDARLRYRLARGVTREHVVRAVVGRKSMADGLHVVDAMAGFGVDATMLAAAGCQVTMIERLPLLAMLLDQGLQNLAADSEATSQLL